MSSDFHFIVPESFHTKFGSDRHSSFLENPVQIFICTPPLKMVDDVRRTTDGRRIHWYTISSPCGPNGSVELIMSYNEIEIVF